MALTVIRRLSPEIPAERNNHQITVLGLKNGNWQMVEAATDVLAGDIFIINGQSNAEANAAPFLDDIDPYTRSWFSPFDWGPLNLSFPGEWGARLAKVLSIQKDLPIAIFNQAQGGVGISEFLPDSLDITTGNYGSLLKRFDLLLRTYIIKNKLINIRDLFNKIQDN